MTAIQEFKKNLIAARDKFEPLLKGDTDKFLEIAANYVEQNQGLLEKDRNSLYASITRAAQQGLYLDGQEAALVPFKGQVKFMSMYKGLLKQVRNSGELASINCGVVYEKDVFEYYVDENGEHIKHVPDFKSKDRGKPVNTYSIARIKDGHAPYIEVMTEEEVQNCKKSSRAGDDSPWNGYFADEMRKKTVLRRIAKRLPSATDLNASIQEDDDLFIPPEDEQQPPPPAPETSERLRKSVAPEKKPESAKASPAPEEKTGKMAEGVIDEVKTFAVQKDGKPATLYSCKLEGQQYLTFDAALYKKMNDAFDKQSTITILWQDAVSASKKAYRDVLDVIFKTVPDEEVPI